MIKLRNLLFGALLVFVQAGVRAATDPVDYVSTLVFKGDFVRTSIVDR